MLLRDEPVPLRIKLSALWVAVMFCYVYGDLFGLMKPGALNALMDGTTGPRGAMAPWVLVAMAMSMAIPSSMVFLTLVLAPPLSRWTNIVLGSAYSLIILATMLGSWSAWGSMAMYYVLLGVIEVVFTVLIVRYAWSWPLDAG